MKASSSLGEALRALLRHHPILLALCTLSASAANAPATRVAIVEGRWHLNGAVTYRGTPAEGLLMNVRMVNSVFEDANDQTRPQDFDAEANTRAFLARIPEYVALGVRAFTLNLQGGQCGWEGAVNSAFNPDGSLRESYLQRVRRVIEACDRHGAVVILGCFYQRQDQHLRDEAAVRAGVVNAARWIRDAGFTNVLLEIANEWGHRGYDHAIFKSAPGQADLIRLAKQTAPGLLVSTSGLGHGRAADEVVRAGDFVLIHFNDTKLPDYAARLNALRDCGKPIVCNEDDKVGEPGAQAARHCVAHGASWGFMHSKVNQYYPFRFQGRADDPVVYAEIQTLTTPAAPLRFPGADWEVVAPEAEGVDSAQLKAAVDYMDANWGRDGAKELFIVRHGRAIWVGSEADAFHPIFSCTKTFTSTVLGLLVDDGKCALDDLAVKYLPELDDQHPLYGKIKLRHLASMCGGYRGEVADKRPDQPWGDVMKYFNPREPYFEAGTHVQYNDHDVFVLGKILTLLGREPLKDVFQRRIAGPIGIRQWEWGVSGTVDGLALNNPPGNPGGTGAGGIKISPRELARFGLLMLNRGQWSGRQLLSAAFVDEATSNRVPLTGGFRNRDFRGRYGFYWWTNGVMVDGQRPWPAAPPKTYMGHGNGGNFCCVVPEWNLVIARTGGPVRGGDKAWASFFERLAPAIGRPGDAAPRRATANTPPPTSAAPSPPRGVGPAPHQIGDWTINRWPGLDVVGDPRGRYMHLVFRDEMKLAYARSDDEGWTWSRPEPVAASGLHPRLALDNSGTLHLVYCSARAKNPGDRMPNDGWYQSRRGGKWSAPVKLNQPFEGALDVRVAVDGNDNVHVLYWAPGTETREMGDHERHRCYYRRKPAGSDVFEPALCFENSVAQGASSHGTLAMGPQGEIHVLYRTFQTAPTWTGNLEHRVRDKDGAWRGDPITYRGLYWADHSLSAAVDLRGNLHVAGYSFRPQGFRFKILRREAGGASLQEVYSEAETYGTSTGIVATPTGDVWAVGSGNWSTRSRPGQPRSSLYHCPASSKSWTKDFLSAAHTLNVDVFCEGPRLIWFRGQVQVFYAEKGLDGKFRLYQKILTAPPPGAQASE